MITNANSRTNVYEISEGIYRINTPIEFPGGAGKFSFNQYLLADDAPLLFHTGPRRMFPLVREAVSRIMAIEQLKQTSWSPAKRSALRWIIFRTRRTQRPCLSALRTSGPRRSRACTAAPGAGMV